MFPVDEILSNEYQFSKKMSENILNWNVEKILKFFEEKVNAKEVINALREEKIDGKTLLLLNERDLYALEHKYSIKLGDLKKLVLIIHKLQSENRNCLVYLGLIEQQSNLINTLVLNQSQYHHTGSYHHHHPSHSNIYTSDRHQDIERISPANSVDGGGSNSAAQPAFATCKPEFFKTVVSLGYAFLVTWITAFVMVVVHERVPDSKRYPPLPDIFLDNVPHISWAFFACEVTGSVLFSVWVCVMIFHKYRIVLIRRFFAMGGTVFLLRCFTMLITSLSVPGSHLQCQASDHKFDDGENLTVFEMLVNRVSRAYTIWSGLGMSIQGVRTCGDYMFSGHTVALTLLNFFITEYTPRNLYFLHTTTWLLNMFGIFFILAAHEHYSIDVFIAFYISSRLFLYYHTLANNQALMSNDSTRTRIWFPLFSYFEESVDGIIPNEYDSLKDIFRTFGNWLMSLKDMCMLTARRIWITQHFNNNSNGSDNSQSRESSKRQKRSQSHTPRRINKSSPTSSAVGDAENRQQFRKSLSNLTLLEGDTTDKSCTKKTNGPSSKKEN